MLCILQDVSSANQGQYVYQAVKAHNLTTRPPGNAYIFILLRVSSKEHKCLILVYSSLFIFFHMMSYPRASLVAQWWGIRLTMQEMWLQSQNQQDSLEEEIATHSCILAWEIPWTEEPGGLQSMWSPGVGRDLAVKQQQQHSILRQWRYFFTLSSISFIVVSSTLPYTPCWK